jgi:hypothetical protein
MQSGCAFDLDAFASAPGEDRVARSSKGEAVLIMTCTPLSQLQHSASCSTQHAGYDDRTCTLCVYQQFKNGSQEEEKKERKAKKERHREKPNKQSEQENKGKEQRERNKENNRKRKRIRERPHRGPT